MFQMYQHEAARDEFDHVKSSEGTVTVHYPRVWPAIAGECDFMRPSRVTVYSYHFGPSRLHEFELGESDRRVGPAHWQSPDPLSKAIEVVRGWAADRGIPLSGGAE